MNFILRITLVFSVLGFTASFALASVSASGSITATQVCEAYVSKNKRTNPDRTKLVKDKTYTVFEVNKANNPSWYRVRVDTAIPTERWVAKRCGKANIEVGGSNGSGGGTGGSDNACRTPGLEDSYVLALSWQPAFCETHRGKPECRIEDKKSYQARNFTLHGLWPNKKSCGIGYAFCGEVRGKPGGFCDYPQLSLFSQNRSDLGQVMPSAAAGSCLQRHQWYKHGTCQTGWSMDEYFALAVDLTRQYNESGIAYFISRNIGKTVTEADFIKKVDCSHGVDTHKRIELKCKDGNLVDVYIRLPSTINQGDGLSKLLQQGQGEFKSNCGGSFKVDPIGFL